MKTAVITGIRGQDASYLAELLLENQYNVVGVERRTGSPDYSNLQNILNHPRFKIVQGDITDSGSMVRIVQEWMPDEFYNLAAQSYVGASWDQPSSTCDINFVGPCNCLEAIRLISPTTKFFQASTSEVYGDVQTDMQDEDTPARPRSPYGASKYGAESLVKVYRDSYNLHACYARAFNHESPRRGKQFVTRKITSTIGEMVKSINSNQPYIKGVDCQTMFECALGAEVIEPIRLGNLEARRDWSHTKDIVRGIWMMMQLDEPDDFVLASGKTRSIREFLNLAFSCVGVVDWEDLVTVDAEFFRPAEINVLCGDATKAHTKLGWVPDISFDELVKEMVEKDIQRAEVLC